MAVFPLPPRRLAIVLRTVAGLGLAAAVLGLIAGWLLLGRTGDALAASLELTDETLTALDASAGVAEETVAALAVSLRTLEATSTDLDTAFDDGELLMRELADLVRDDVASSVGAVEDSLPGLITVAGTIDSTLQALSSLPIGPDYDPAQSFADSLRTLQGSVDGLDSQLVDQADVIEQTAGSLADVGAGVGDLAGEIASFDAALTDTAELLGTYDATIAEGRDLVAQATDDLGSQLVVTRMALVLLAVAFAAMQVVPLQMAAMVDRVDARGGPDRRRRRRSIRPSRTVRPAGRGTGGPGAT
ncbi:hypothetical protein [Euzebya sp.]|uniref:hypothetical protein n=1 Tax=Euzebya sp. TaxID=1971409 RepID=UPI0035149CE4